jgi:hypothetical protein
MSFDPNTDAVDGTEDFYNVDDLTTRMAVLVAANCGEPANEDGCGDEDCFSHNPERDSEVRMLRDLLSDDSLGTDIQTLYRDSYMEDYARDQAEDLISGAEYLFPYVDWSSVAADLAMDMTNYNVAGHEYYGR